MTWRKAPWVVMTWGVLVWGGTATLGSAPAAATHGSASGVAEGDSLAAVAYGRAWLRLLHYEAKSGGGWESRADAPTFFFAPDGKRDPLAELKATLKAFAEGHPLVGPARQAPHCAFPARRRFLAAALGTNIPDGPCPDFDEWRAGLDARHVTLIFSAYYATNPASTFGHTFLRLDQGQGPGVSREAADLLNYAVSFGAYVDTDNPIAYGVKGIFGGFLGFFFVDPYYMKVREYAWDENRDLWEYGLRLTPAQVDFLVAHLWEQYGSNHYRYYFFDENCAFQLLALLEAAAPEWDLLARVHGMVLPVDTVRAVTAQPDAVDDVRYRPSLRKRLQAALALLTAEGRDEFDALRAGKDAAAARDPAALDAFILHMQARKARAKGQLSPEDAGRMESALARRAALGVGPAETSLEGERPDRGHATHRAETGVLRRPGEARAAAYATAAYGLHDFLDSPYGYGSHLAVDFVAATASIGGDQGQARLDDFRLLDIASLPPFHAHDPQPSWYFRAQLPDAGLADCLACRAPALDGGIGLANGSDDGRYLLFALARAGLEWRVAGADNPWAATPGARVGGWWRFATRGRWLLDATWRWPVGPRRKEAAETEAGSQWGWDVAPGFTLVQRAAVSWTAGRNPEPVALGLGLRWHF